MKKDILAVIDRGENVASFEPLRMSDAAADRPTLTELAVELTGKAAGFRRSLPAGVTAALAELVRAMNCYYSNLIEGHDTHPFDIERAMRNDYSRDPRKRDLQHEARAHVVVQQWIDDGALAGHATTREAICEIHRRFCELLPESLRWIEDPESGERVRVVPGELRQRDARVGNHVPISAGAIPRFLVRYAEAFSTAGRAETIISAAAAHHRLLWIHPFLDGNGRVARLVSHATLLQALDTGGLWSIARGLARRNRAYKDHLIACDQPRQGDTDGRGTLSERALAEFTQFFLETCIDQVEFMEGLVQPDRLRDRILIWTEEGVRGGRLPSKAGIVLENLLYRGQLPRADMAGLLGIGERQARRVVSELLDVGVISSSGARAPLVMAFPARLAGRWLPGLFPEPG